MPGIASDVSRQMKPEKHTSMALFRRRAEVTICIRAIKILGRNVTCFRLTGVAFTNPMSFKLKENTTDSCPAHALVEPKRIIARHQLVAEAHL